MRGHLIGEARTLRVNCPEEISFFLEQVEYGTIALVADGRLGTFDHTNELQLTSVLTSGIGWRQRLAADFIIHHDESSNFFAAKDLWAAATRSDIAPRPQPLGDGSSVEFPLRVRETHAARSHAHPAIQLADILAGLFARAGRGLVGEERDPFLLELLDLGIGEVSFLGIYPRAEFPLGEPVPADGPDAVDLMTHILAPAFQGRAAKPD